jgi:hypothetical protein
VQGQLLGEIVSVEIETVCAHCEQSLQITLDSEMSFRVQTEGAEPLIFEPQINWPEFTEPNIINAY